MALLPRCFLPLTLPGDPSSGAPDAAPPSSPRLTGLACGPEPLYCLGRDEGTDEFLDRGASDAAAIRITLCER